MIITPVSIGKSFWAQKCTNNPMFAPKTHSKTLCENYFENKINAIATMAALAVAKATVATAKAAMVAVAVVPIWLLHWLYSVYNNFFKS